MDLWGGKMSEFSYGLGNRCRGGKMPHLSRKEVRTMVPYEILLKSGS